MYDNYKQVKLLAEVGDDAPCVVFARVRSVSADEAVRAYQMSAKAKYQLTVNSLEYGRQMYVEIDGEVYAVYRTYDASADKVELYVEDKLGVYNG